MNGVLQRGDLRRNGIRDDPAYVRLKNHLAESTGLTFDPHRDSELAELIAQRLCDLRMKDCSSYADFLAADAAAEAEMEVLIGRLTVGETYFFRDPEQFAAIRDIILPDILSRNRSSGRLRIWSAGCATGAEPYSLAILLMREVADQLAGWEVAIDATDLNRAYLALAAEGKFRAWALRATSDEVKRACFSNEGRTWTIDPRYKRWISFRHMNLAGGEFAGEPNAGDQFDLILCRNVMIYFTPEASRDLIGNLYQSLEYGGWLVVGAAEYGVDNYTAFRTVEAAGARLYQKMPPLREPPEQLPAALPAKLVPTPTFGQHAELGPASLEGLCRLTGLGDWRSAAEYGRRLLMQDRLNPAVHFHRAVIFRNLGISLESARSLRKAIYLDRNFAMAHYGLALWLKKDGQASAAARSFGNVLKVLAGAPDEALVSAGGGETVGGLKELARMQMAKTRES